MTDSAATDTQPGAKTIDVNRYNGLMSNHQKALAENAALKARLAGFEASGAQDGGGDPAASEQTPQYQEGEHYVFDGQGFTPWEPPTPQRHGESSWNPTPRPNSADEHRAALDRQVGKPSRIAREWDLGV